MDFIFEILFNIFLELMMLIVPEDKATSAKYRYGAVTIAAVGLLGVIALFVWGIGLIAEGDPKGAIPMSIAAILALAQIIVGFVLYIRRTK